MQSKAPRGNCQGTVTNKDGSKYVGKFKDGKYNGQGTLTWADGDKYVGEFRDGDQNGQGTYTGVNGDKYVGEYKNGERNGQGTSTRANGDKYVGEFKDGKENGQGTFISINGDKYVGEFKDNKPNGQGTFTGANGNKYVGEFKVSQPNGQGTFTSTNGNTYVGEFKDNKLNGQGTLTSTNGNKYVGEFKDNKPNGQGTLTGVNGSIISAGIWVDGRFSECLNYVGQTVETATIMEALGPLGSFAAKGEFETRADFQARLNSQITGKLDRILMIRKDSEGPEAFEYDADNKLLRIKTWAFSNEHFSSLFLNIPSIAGNGVASVISRNEQVVGRYPAKNGLGSIIDVVKLKWTTTVIFDRPAPDGHRQSDFIGQLRLEPDEAQRIKPGLKVALVVLPRTPYVIRGSHRPFDPTKDNPKDVTEDYVILIANIQCRLVMNSDNKVLGAYPAN